MTEQIIQIIGGFVVGGGLVGVLAAWFDFRAKKMDNSAQERREMKEELRLLNSTLNELQLKYNKMHADFSMQESEIKYLRNKVKQLEGYKDQYKLIGRCRSALNQYLSDNKVDELVKVLTKELMS